ncbi:hypothetical protein K469DRAFT_710759 [Zopfia rhizophila CBS 207.26]|uniref:Acyclic terpene utilisation N-terminal domain-containing protein n=1 Tax=Zopfia rhizophila CBS 207.26 TaxID=1314779 RepID=A0A6A6DYV4_9PEZI|nr:hypothetical protein K469DRAFT_710759 [Zopfia rhizophila CBS 207.26]
MDLHLEPLPATPPFHSSLETAICPSSPISLRNSPMGTAMMQLTACLAPTAPTSRASGGFSVREHSISSLAKLEVDVIIGKLRSEYTMTLHGVQKVDDRRLRAERKLQEEPVGYFRSGFYRDSPALPNITGKGIKVAVNTWACNTELLAGIVEEEVKE